MNSVLLLLSKHLQGTMELNELLRQHCNEMVELVSSHLEAAMEADENVFTAVATDKRVGGRQDTTHGEKDSEALQHLQNSLTDDGIFANSVQELIKDENGSWSLNKHPDLIPVIGIIVIEAYRRMAEPCHDPETFLPLLLHIERMTMDLFAICILSIQTEKGSRERLIHHFVQGRGKKQQKLRGEDIVRESLSGLLTNKILSKGGEKKSRTWLALMIFKKIPDEAQTTLSPRSITDRLKEMGVDTTDLVPGGEEELLKKISLLKQST